MHNTDDVSFVTAPECLYVKPQSHTLTACELPLVDQTSKQDILAVQGDWNAKDGEDAQEDWGEFVDLSAIRRPMTEGSSS